MTTNQNQRELVRLLYIEHGHQKASELSGVNYTLVRKWASRYGWTEPRQQTLSQNVTRRVADAVADDLAEHERETRLSLAKASRRMAKDCEELAVRDADKAYTVAKTAAIVHRWNDEKQGGSFNLNLLNLADLNLTIGGKPVE